MHVLTALDKKQSKPSLKTVSKIASDKNLYQKTNENVKKQKNKK